MLDHQAIIDTSSLRFFKLPLLEILRDTMTFLLGIVLDLERTQLVGPSARRAEICVQTLSSPGCLDNEHRLIERRIHGETKGKFRSDILAGLAGILSPHRAVTCGESSSEIEVRLISPSEVRDPRVLAHGWFSVRATHLPE